MKLSGQQHAASTGVSVQALIWRIASIKEFPVLLGLLVVGTIFALTTDSFLTSFNIFQLMRQMVVLAVISVGMTYVIAAGEIDISVGSIYNLAANVMALLIATAGWSPWGALLAALLIGTLAGALNGLLSVMLRLPTLIVTLGTISLYRGLTVVLSNGLSVGNLPPSDYYNIGSERIGAIPQMALVALAIVFVAALALRHTVFARQLLAIGSNTEGARRAGIRVNVRKIQVMALLGLMCGVGAALGIAYLRSASPQSGAGFELLAIAAVVIGGTPLQGGVGTIWGTLIGITLIMVIQNGLILLGIPAVWQIAATGLMILGAVAIQQLVRKYTHTAGR